MQLEVGSTLVYPHHGAVTITEVKQRTIKGEEKTYLTMEVHASKLTIQLPVDSLETVGVRSVIDDEGVQRVYDVLQADFVEEQVNWSRRYKSNEEKIKSGDVFRVSEVVRDLWRRESTVGVSAGEKNMLARARSILESELALALPDGEAKETVDRVLATPAGAPVA